MNTPESRLARIEEHIKSVEASVEHIDKILNRAMFGQDGTTGVFVRLDRIEQWKTTVSRVLWILAGAVATIGTSIVSDHLH